MPKLLPYLQVPDFLGEELAGRVLGYAIAHEAGFKASSVGEKADQTPRVDEKVRVSRVMRDLGELGPILQDRFRAFLPRMLDGLRMAPFKPQPQCELELAAHGDGAFYKPHIDMRRGETGDRVVSAVYYLHGQPKAFSGGGLRIFPNNMLPGDDEAVVIPPTHDSLLVFPSHVMHEVMPVSCPGVAFKDYRFAINCWVHRDNRPD
jgi:Rps23 Pro-64 3,4-dihydroxylase Tpa1-like proline 4-hydroxylase